MEQLVRPFQLLDPTSTVRVDVVRDQVAIEPAHVCWGAAGNLPKAVQQADNFNGINFRVEECDTSLGEQSRDTEDVRIEQDGKPENFIIMQRIRHIKLKNTSKSQVGGDFQDGTLNLQFPDFFAGTPFGKTIKQDKCGQDVYYNR